MYLFPCRPYRIKGCYVEYLSDEQSLIIILRVSSMLISYKSIITESCMMLFPCRPVLSHHLAATTTTTVQITIQQPRTTQEVTGRSLPGQPPQHITSKPIHTSHPIIQQQHQPQQHAAQHPATPTSQLPPQAKLMSQAAIAPIIHHATAAASSTGGTAIPKSSKYHTQTLLNQLKLGNP